MRLECGAGALHLSVVEVLKEISEIVMEHSFRAGWQDSEALLTSSCQ